MEVAEHVKHRLEPQVLYVTLAVAVQGQAQVLWVQVGVVRGGSGAGHLGKRLWGLMEGPRLTGAGWGCVRTRGPLTHEPHLGVGNGGNRPRLGWKASGIVPMLGHPYYGPMSYTPLISNPLPNARRQGLLPPC